MIRLFSQIIFSGIYLMSSNFAMASERPQVGGPPADMTAYYFAQQWNQASTLGKFLHQMDPFLTVEEMDGIVSVIKKNHYSLETPLPKAVSNGAVIQFDSGDKVQIMSDGAISANSQIYRKSGSADKLFKIIVASSSQGKSAQLMSLLLQKAYAIAPLILAVVVVALVYLAW